jgi:DNA-binding CsgD family transcriptional regulator
MSLNADVKPISMGDRRRERPGRRPRDFVLTDRVDLLDPGFTETPRQRQVLDGVALGLENKEIAAALGITQQRTKEVVSRLLQKFDVRSRAALARAAINMRILGLDTRATIPYSYFFDESPVLMAVTEGPEHRFALVNSAYVQVFGDRQYHGRSFRECFPDASAAALSAIDLTYAGGRRYTESESRLSYRMPGGSRRAFDISFITEAIRSASNEITGIIYYGWDVTAAVVDRRMADPPGTDQQRLWPPWPIDAPAVILTKDAERPAE